jgi:hypothetical protein
MNLDDWQADVVADSLGERADGTWAAREVGLVVSRQNGKGLCIEAREIGGLFLLGERLQLHSAHEFKTAVEAFRRIQHWIDNCDALRKRVKRIANANGDEGIELVGGARLRFVARSKGSGRGFSGDLIVLDEAYALTDEQMAALMPTISARPNPQIWYTSTPPLEPAAMLVKLRERGHEGAKRLAYFEWSPEPGYKPDDRAVWQATNPAMGIRIPEESIEAERDALSAEAFCRERLGDWPQEASGQWQVIAEQLWTDALDPASEIAGSVALAVDVSPARTDSAIAVAGRRPDGDRHVELVEHREGVGWVIRRVKAICSRQPVCVVVVDGAGPAASLIPDLERELEPLEIPIHKLGARECAAAFGAFLDGLVPPSDDPDDEIDVDSSSIWHLDQAPLSVALAGAIKRPLSGGHAWDRSAPDVDITPIVAATSALYGHSRYGHLTGSVELEGSLMA